MESMPAGFWVLYGIILSLVLISSIIYWVIRKFSPLAAIALIFSLLLPLISFVYTVQRTEGSPYEYIMIQLQADHWLAIFIAVGYVYISIWLLIVLADLLIKAYKIPYVYDRLNWLGNKIAHYWNRYIYQHMKRWLLVIKEKLSNKKNKNELHEEPRKESQ
ncbi:hypothetical protein [Oceanobacillus halophilus]|uniref:Uncharacterized protein n=1 Tax=Oceanobacillus halophilus TaxID=930130 RepID=A0A495A2P8_9BACI|nr:hypothetical protein [Oceanobacillus halophilus]RKQ33867.1 hypothetical protein D8M06_08545 [Oceanobacillus halophilus]